MGKYKPITRLGHQYGAVLSEPILTAEEIAEALYEAELVEYGLAKDADGLPTHYTDTLFQRVPIAEYRALITAALTSYCRRRGYEYAIAGQPTQSQPTDHYDPSDFGV